MVNNSENNNSVNMIWENIGAKYKYTFFISVIIGIVTHGMVLFNKYAIHDEAAYYLYDGGMSDWWTTGGTYKAGRWMLGLIGQISGIIIGDNISTSTLAGLISIILLSLSACFLVATLKIKSKMISVLMGLLMVICPVIVGLFGFMYIAPQYMFGFFLGFAGTYFICQKTSGIRWLIGIILMAASVGVYQAFAPNILCIMLFCFIRDNCISDVDYKRMLKEIFYYLISILGFIFLYFVINKFFLIFYNYELIQYKGINSMLDLSDIGIRFVKAIHYIFIPQKSVSDVVFPQTIIYVYYVAVIIWGGSTVYFLYTSKYEDNRLIKKTVSMIAFLCIPLAANFIYIMCDEKYVVGHMAYGQTMFFLYILFVLDILLNSEAVFWIKEAARFVVVVIGLTCILYMRFDNITYIKAEIGQERMISWSTTLVTRIKSVEGYNDNYPVIYIGMRNITDDSISDIEAFDFITDTPYYDIETQINDYALQRFITIWTGFDPKISYDTSKVINDDHYKSMPCYPNDGSIAVINENVVIKFAEQN